MTGPEQPVEVRDDPAATRYEVVVGGEVAGFAAYYRAGDRVVLVHTEIDDRFEGQGLGSRLARAALDDIRRRGGRVVPACPFIAGWIRRHPDYDDLVAARR